MSGVHTHIYIYIQHTHIYTYIQHTQTQWNTFTLVNTAVCSAPQEMKTVFFWWRETTGAGLSLSAHRVTWIQSDIHIHNKYQYHTNDVAPSTIPMMYHSEHSSWWVSMHQSRCVIFNWLSLSCNTFAYLILCLYTCNTSSLSFLLHNRMGIFWSHSDPPLLIWGCDGGQ